MKLEIDSFWKSLEYIGTGTLPNLFLSFFMTLYSCSIVMIFVICNLHVTMNPWHLIIYILNHLNFDNLFHRMFATPKSCELLVNWKKNFLKRRTSMSGILGNSTSQPWRWWVRQPCTTLTWWKQCLCTLLRYARQSEYCFMFLSPFNGTD